MITIIDYGLGNLASVANALNKLGIPNQVSNSPNVIKKARVLILPGVGAAGQGMQNLKNLNLDKVIIEEIKRGKPFLGICLGMQLLFEESGEGNVACLEILKGVVKKYKKERKVPQIGWNEVKIQYSKIKMQNYNSKVKKILSNIKDLSYFYFVNSYYCEPDDTSIVVAESEYGEKFASIVMKDNIIATQFHPEKSGSIGQQLLKNIFTYFNDLNH